MRGWSTGSYILRHYLLDRSVFFHSFKFFKFFKLLDTAIDENHTIFVIGAITDTLVELTEGVLRGRASKGKALPIYYIGMFQLSILQVDNEQGHYYSALTRYSRHPECCSEDIKKRM